MRPRPTVLTPRHVNGSPSTRRRAASSGSGRHRRPGPRVRINVRPALTGLTQRADERGKLRGDEQRDQSPPPDGLHGRNALHRPTARGQCRTSGNTFRQERALGSTASAISRDANESDLDGRSGPKLLAGETARSGCRARPMDDAPAAGTMRQGERKIACPTVAADRLEPFLARRPGAGWAARNRRPASRPDAANSKCSDRERSCCSS